MKTTPVLFSATWWELQPGDRGTLFHVSVEPPKDVFRITGKGSADDGVSHGPFEAAARRLVRHMPERMVRLFAAEEGLDRFTPTTAMAGATPGYFWVTYEPVGRTTVAQPKKRYFVEGPSTHEVAQKFSIAA